MTPILPGLLNSSVLSYFSPETQGEDKKSDSPAQDASAQGDAPATSETPKAVDISHAKSAYFSYFLQELAFLNTPEELGARQSLFKYSKGEGSALHALLADSDLTLRGKEDDKGNTSWLLGVDCEEEVTSGGDHVLNCKNTQPIPTFITGLENLINGDTNSDGNIDLTEARALIDQSPRLQELGVDAEVLLRDLETQASERYNPIGKNFQNHILTLSWYRTFDAFKLASAGVLFAELRDATSSLHPNHAAKWVPNGANMFGALFVKPFLGGGGWLAEKAGWSGLAELNDIIPWAFMDNFYTNWAIEEKKQRDEAMVHFAEAVDDAILAYIEGDENFAWVAAMDSEVLAKKRTDDMDDEAWEAFKKEARLESLQGALDYMASEQFANRMKEKEPFATKYQDTPMEAFAKSAEVLQEQLPVFELHNIVTQDDPAKMANDLLTFAEEEFPFAFGLRGGHASGFSWRHNIGQLNNTTLAEGIINAVKTQRWSEDADAQKAIVDRATKLYTDLKGDTSEFSEWSEDDELHLPGYVLSYFAFGPALFKGPDIVSDLRKYARSLNGHAMMHLGVQYARQGLLHNMRWAPMQGGGISGLARGVAANMGHGMLNLLKVGGNLFTGGLRRGIGSEATHEAIMAYNAAPGSWGNSLDMLRYGYRIPFDWPSRLLDKFLYILKPITSRLSKVGQKADEVSDAAGANKVKKGLQTAGEVAHTGQMGILRFALAAFFPPVIHDIFTKNQFSFSSLFSEEDPLRKFILPDKLGEDASRDERVEAAFVESFNLYDRSGNFYPKKHEGARKPVDLRPLPDPRKLDEAFKKSSSESEEASVDKK